MTRPKTLKGFRDFLPVDARKRQFLIGKFKEVFESFGFDGLETPALEYAETLLGKYGQEADKLLYVFKDNGGRSVGMRYDQTVPLARVIAQYPQLPMPWKRYQIQPVWRAENTQKGRYREFLQCDIDIVGSSSPLSDAEIIACTLTVCKTLGFSKSVMAINDRTIFDSLGLTKKEIIIIDKLDKIGQDRVIEGLKKSGRTDAEQLFTKLKESVLTEQLSLIVASLKRLGWKEQADFVFDPFLARGLDYYTSSIFELKTASYSAGSLAGGGRYDQLIGQFSGKNVPAVGIAFGFDRMLEAMEEANLLPLSPTSSQVLVTIFSPDLVGASLTITSLLRSSGVNAEVTLDPQAKLEKQLKYADRKGIPYVIIQGPDEAKRGVVKLKNMKSKEQEEMTVEDVTKKLRTH